MSAEGQNITNIRISRKSMSLNSLSAGMSSLERLEASSSLAGSLVPENTTDVLPSTSPGSSRSHRDKNFLKPKSRDGSHRRSADFGTGLGGRSTGSSTKIKPTRELYRPPVINCLNPTAKEFAPLQSSRSFDLAAKGPHDNIILNRTGLTITVPGKNNSLSKSRSVTSQHSIDRGGGDLGNQIDLNLFAFPLEVVNTLTRALEDPNRVPSRSLMELVKQIISRAINGSTGIYMLNQNLESRQDSSKLPEQAARLCIGIIEKEERETFLESLINTCQELYHDRERVLREDINQWNSYISFLNNMYCLLKRKQLHFLRKYEGVAPKLVLLSLLAECCTATLTSTLQYISEIETLFVVLTHIGKDLEIETPGRMSLLVTCLREAFLTSQLNKQIGKTLLQLIELRAAGWNLPAQAVMYYYPGSS